MRVFKPATAKGASKSFDDHLCDVARVVEAPGSDHHPVALVAFFGDRTVRAYSLPALKEIGRSRLAALDPSRTMAAALSRTGHLLAWTGPSEIAVLPVFAGGAAAATSPDDTPAGPSPGDTLVSPDRALPPRPTISSLQWISGTQYVSPTDLDLLIGGESRPPSKRMIAAAAAERAGAGAGAGTYGSRSQQQQQQQQKQEGWGEYLARQVNERTERLTAVEDAMNRLQETSQGWAEEVNKYVKKQKRNMLLGGLKKSLY